MERFQNKKPTKEDHKPVKHLAKAVKVGATIVSSVFVAKKVVVDNKEKIIDIAKSVVFKL